VPTSAGGDSINPADFAMLELVGMLTNPQGFDWPWIGGIELSLVSAMFSPKATCEAF
jgi:hypothetical protein